MKRVIVGMRVLDVVALLAGVLCIGCQRRASVTAGGPASVTAELAVDWSVQLGETRLVKGHVVVRAENKGDSPVSVDFTQARLRFVADSGGWSEQTNSPTQGEIRAIGRITLKAKERREFKIPVEMGQVKSVRPEILGVSFGSGGE